MNRLLKFFVLFSMIFLLTNICYSAEKDPEKVEITKGVYLEHNTEPYIIDKLFLIASENKEYKEIFVSEGNKIEEVKTLDIDSDGNNEYLISMFTGGSGGFYDLTIIKEQDGKWVSIWDDSMAQPSIEIENKKGKVSIKIEHFEVINDSPKKVTSVINYENGKFIKH